MSSQLQGIAASGGFGFGKAHILVDPDLSIEKKSITDGETEKARLHKALETTKSELTKIRELVAKKQGEENAAIFDAHLLVIADPELIGSIEGKIDGDQVNAEVALQETTD